MEQADAHVDVPVEKLTRAYLNLKNRRSELSAAFREEDSALKEQQDRIKRALLDYCDHEQVESVRTKAGLFYRSVKSRYWVNDWDAFGDYVVKHDIPEVYAKSLNQSNVKQYLDDNPEEVLPGLNVDSEYTITVRKG